MTYTDSNVVLPAFYALKATFLAELEQEKVPSNALVFIGDAKQIYTHGIYFDLGTDKENTISAALLALNNRVDSATEIQVGGQTPTDSNIKIYIDESNDDTVEIYTKDLANSKYVVITESDSIPTNSTLTYVENGINKNYKVGDKIVYINNNLFTIYTLKSLVNNIATWGLEGGFAQANWNETDSSNPSYILNKPTIPSSQIQSDWNLTNVSALDYIKNKPTIIEAEHLIVTVILPNGTTAGDTITIAGSDYVLDENGLYEIDIASGTSYTIQATTKVNYVTPTAKTFTASLLSREVIITYEPITDGIFAITANGDKVDLNSAGSSCVGVGVIDSTNNISFWINKNMPIGSSASTSITNYKAWATNSYNLTVNSNMTYSGSVGSWSNDDKTAGCPTALRTWALSSYSSGRTGIVNTTAIVNKYTSDTASNNAAKYCRSVTNPLNGNKDGYLLSMAECITILDNFEEINQYMDKIAGVKFGYSMAGTSSAYMWVSAEYNTDYAWYWGWTSSYLLPMFANNNKYRAGQHYCVRVCYPL